MLVAASVTRMKSACSTDQPPAYDCFCDGTAMKVQPTEQACGPSVVRGRGGLKTGACGTHVRVLYRTNQPPAYVFASAMEPS